VGKKKGAKIWQKKPTLLVAGWEENTQSSKVILLIIIVIEDINSQCSEMRVRLGRMKQPLPPTHFESYSSKSYG
jgi:hypothetical protein